ncbi:VOC family protein [Embleya sp. NPDC008237]|uniref:VOC family protein n=1 Tax=Embleya sp. NPDC008237 TaxID=3363978 RepID=UPI0036E3073C
MPDLESVPVLHHIAVQTDNLDNSISWYEDFFGGRLTWATDIFSDLTVSRLPGVVRMAELAVGAAHFHLFERGTPADRRAAPDAPRFQHVCLSVETPAELRTWRSRWLELSASHRYAFVDPEQPTEIVTDAQGTQSFYCLDVNGLEFEFTCIGGAVGENA